MKLNWDAVITSSAELLAHDQALMTRTFPDGQLTLTNLATATGASGPGVYATFEFSGTMSGPFPSGEGAPTQRAAKTCGMACFKLDAAGRIVEVHNYVNQYALLVTAGLIAPLGASTMAATGAPGGGGAVKQGQAQPVAGQPVAGGAVPVYGTTTSAGTGAGGAMDTQARGL